MNELSGDCLTFFSWISTINGADYTSLQLGFHKDGTLDSFRDDRTVYAIGDTSINISREQAIDIALENLSDYSYEMSDHSVVMDFNVTVDKIVAKLATSPVNSVLRPYWDIRMPLNQTYPGSVVGITAFLWANTGEIISYSNIAFGGTDYPETTTSPEPTKTPLPTPQNSAPKITPSATITPTTATTSQTERASNPPQATEKDNSTPVDMSIFTAVTLTAIALVLVSLAAIKLKSKQ
jgi:hypothetical protein